MPVATQARPTKPLAIRDGTWQALRLGRDVAVAILYELLTGRPPFEGLEGVRA